VFMWDKRKGKPKYDQKDDNAWLSPYIIKKKSKKEKYYLKYFGQEKDIITNGWVSSSTLHPEGLDLFRAQGLGN
jgi:hypothetical protein